MAQCLVCKMIELPNVRVCPAGRTQRLQYALIKIYSQSKGYWSLCERDVGVLLPLNGCSDTSSEFLQMATSLGFRVYFGSTA